MWVISGIDVNNKINNTRKQKRNIRLLLLVIIEPCPRCLPPKTYTFKMVPILRAITLDHPGVKVWALAVAVYMKKHVCICFYVLEQVLVEMG